MESYCVKCKTKTGSANPVEKVAKNGRAMLQSQCAVCGTTKSQFIKKGAGLAKKVQRSRM